jgi:hypothetical protein
MATPVNIRSDLQIDDLHMEDDSEVISIVKAAATVLGTIEDVEIVAGTDPAAPFAPDRVPRNALARARLNLPGIGGNTRIAAVAPGGRPTGLELVMAIESGLNALDAAGRPGDYGLLLHHRLVRILATPSAPGVPPLLEQLPPLLGSDKIAGTNALNGAFAVPLVAGILFRLEPPAVDVVHTMPPTLSVMQRTPGQTALRIEEDIVVRILDQAAVHHITYWFYLPHQGETRDERQITKSDSCKFSGRGAPKDWCVRTWRAQKYSPSCGAPVNVMQSAKYRLCDDLAAVGKVIDAGV